MADISKITLPNNNSYTIKDDSAVANITRSGTTFTATRRNGTTFTFTQQDSDTTYSAGSGLSLSGTTFNHTNSITAGTVGTSSATNGTTLEIPYVTYDAQGHITASGIHNHSLGEAAEHDVDFTIDGNSTESMNLPTTQAVMELFSSQEEISIGTTAPIANNFKLWIQI